MAKLSAMTADTAEEQLLKHLLTGSVAAFDILYHKYKQAVYANIRKMIRQEDVAQDILQEVFLALWQHRRKIRHDRPVGGWLFVVSYNKSASYLKKQLKTALVSLEGREEVLEEMPAAEENMEEIYQTQLAVIEAAIGQLPDRKKLVFQLCKLEGKSFEEVSAITGISVNSVKDYIKQSTRFIKACAHREYKSSGLAAILLLINFLGK